VTHDHKALLSSLPNTEAARICFNSNKVGATTPIFLFFSSKHARRQLYPRTSRHTIALWGHEREVSHGPKQFAAGSPTQLPKEEPDTVQVSK